eukprot:Rhum_TRINITY_DN14488_c13_g1::Rhum_TRINITY_DN14488_c13_g1_i1::g.92662::m.92662
MVVAAAVTTGSSSYTCLGLCLFRCCRCDGMVAAAAGRGRAQGASILLVVAFVALEHHLLNLADLVRPEVRVELVELNLPAAVLVHVVEENVKLQLVGVGHTRRLRHDREDSGDLVLLQLAAAVLVCRLEHLQRLRLRRVRVGHEVVDKVNVHLLDVQLLLPGGQLLHTRPLRAVGLGLQQQLAVHMGDGVEHLLVQRHVLVGPGRDRDLRHPSEELLLRRLVPDHVHNHRRTLEHAVRRTHRREEPHGLRRRAEHKLATTAPRRDSGNDVTRLHARLGSSAVSLERLLAHLHRVGVNSAANRTSLAVADDVEPLRLRLLEVSQVTLETRTPHVLLQRAQHHEPRLPPELRVVAGVLLRLGLRLRLLDRLRGRLGLRDGLRDDLTLDDLDGGRLLLHRLDDRLRLLLRLRLVLVGLRQEQRQRRHEEQHEGKDQERDAVRHGVVVADLPAHAVRPLDVEQKRERDQARHGGERGEAEGNQAEEALTRAAAEQVDGDAEAGEDDGDEAERHRGLAALLDVVAARRARDRVVLVLPHVSLPVAHETHGRLSQAVVVQACLRRVLDGVQGAPVGENSSDKQCHEGKHRPTEHMARTRGPTNSHSCYFASPGVGRYQ